MGKHDGFVETRCAGIINGKGTIDVGSRDFGTHRHGVTVGPSPGRGADTQARANIDVVTHGERVDGCGVIQRVERELDGARGLIGDGAPVVTLAGTMFAYKLDGDTTQAANRSTELHAQAVPGVAHASRAYPPF